MLVYLSQDGNWDRSYNDLHISYQEMWDGYNESFGILPSFFMNT